MFWLSITWPMKKHSERRKHCTLAVVRRNQKISPRHRPLPGGAGRPKFNQLEMVTTFTYKTQFGEDRCTQSWVIVLTDPPTHKQTGPITIHCTAASAQCKYTQWRVKYSHPIVSVGLWQCWLGVPTIIFLERAANPKPWPLQNKSVKVRSRETADREQVVSLQTKHPVDSLN